jgi:NitT/TauT family transport system substrate-binding protein
MLGRCATAMLLLSLMVPAVQAEPQTVHVQMVRTLAQAPYYIAVANGYFEKEGLAVESTNVRSALDTIAPLAMGQLDVGIGAATSGFFNAASRNFDMRIVAALGYQGPVMSTQPLIRKALWDDGSIRSGKDFRGHKVAINTPGDITEYFFTLTARKYGMSIKDMNIVPLGFSEQLAAFKNGAIDAGSLPEPLSSTAQQAGTVVLDKADVSDGSGTITTFVYFGTKFMQERRDVALAFLRALVRGARDSQGPYLQDPKIAASIAQQTNLSVEAVENSTPYAIDPNLDIEKFEKSLRDQETVHRENGHLNYSGELSFKDVIDPSLVHEAAASVK